MNLLFGDYNSYLLQHMMQYIGTPSMLVSTGGKTKFQPIDSEGLVQAVEKSLEGSAEAGLYHVAGEQVFTHQEIADMLAKALGQPTI